MFALSGFSVASWICLGCGAVVKLCSDGVISRSGAVVELFSVVGKDAGAIAQLLAGRINRQCCS